MKVDLLNNMTEDKLNDICKQKNILIDINNNIIKNTDKLLHIINELSSIYEEDVNSNMILSDIHMEQKEIVKSINNLININSDLLDVYKNLIDRIN
jgi:Mg2+ and Co2+ transporter CorA